MTRTLAQNRCLHSILGDFSRQFSHDGVHLTAQEWKVILVVYFRLALAEADGYPIPEAVTPESTSKMDAERMGNLIEYCLFIGATMGIEFSE